MLIYNLTFDSTCSRRNPRMPKVDLSDVPINPNVHLPTSNDGTSDKLLSVLSRHL